MWPRLKMWRPGFMIECEEERWRIGWRVRSLLFFFSTCDSFWVQHLRNGCVQLLYFLGFFLLHFFFFFPYLIPFHFSSLSQNATSCFLWRLSHALGSILYPLMAEKRTRTHSWSRQLWPDGRDILPRDTQARRQRLWEWRRLRDDWFNHHHRDQMASRVDMEKRYGDESAGERVRTHHHSDVLGQVPGAPLEEIRERRLHATTRTCTYNHNHNHTHTDVGRQGERKPIIESQFVAFASLKKVEKKSLLHALQTPTHHLFTTCDYNYTRHIKPLWHSALNVSSSWGFSVIWYIFPPLQHICLHTPALAPLTGECECARVSVSASASKVKRDTHSCIEHLVAEATVKLLWVGFCREE